MPNGTARAFAAWIATHEPHADRPDEVFAAGFESALMLFRFEAAKVSEGCHPDHTDFYCRLGRRLKEMASRIQEGTWPTT